MKLSCTQENLNKGLSITSRIVGTRTTLPVLNNILLATDKGRLKLAATDLEIGISTWIGAKVEKEGSITIPARLLTEYISTNTDKTIDLEIKDVTLNLKSDHYQSSIKGIEASEFPLIPHPKQEIYTQIPATLLKEAVSQTCFAVSFDETRPILTGALLRFKDNDLKIVSTDSYRLAEKTIPLGAKVKENKDIVVPVKTLVEIGRIISGADEKVSVTIGENQVLFALNDSQIVSRLIEGTFPDYESIIPPKLKTKAILERGGFENIIKMASFFARESANNIQLTVSSGKTEVRATSPQLGENTSTIKSETEGEKIDISFNAKFILDVLAVIGSQKISLELNDKLSPGLIKPVGAKDFTYVIMPLRAEE